MLHRYSKNQKILLGILLIIPAVCFLLTAWFRYRIHEPWDITLAMMMNYNEKGEHEKMAAVYEPLIKKYPDRADILSYYAWAQYKIGNYDVAADAIRRSMEMYPYLTIPQNYYAHKILKKGSN